MANPWDADLFVDPSLAADLIGRQFADLGHRNSTLLVQGWDNWVYGGGSDIFRFPRRRTAIPGTAREITVLTRLAPRLPVAIPIPQWLDQPGPDYPYPWFGYGRIPRTPVAELFSSGQGRAALAAPLGRFLATLHHIAPQQARQLGAGDPH